jgi:hypothetical protein
MGIEGGFRDLNSMYLRGLICSTGYRSCDNSTLRSLRQAGAILKGRLDSSFRWNDEVLFAV